MPYVYSGEKQALPWYYRVVVPDTQHTNPGKLQQRYVTAVSSTWHIVIRPLQQLVPGTAVYEDIQPTRPAAGARRRASDVRTQLIHQYLQ